MINIIVAMIVIIAVGAACRYIYKEKKNGKKCIGCPYSGSSNCHCNDK